MMRKLQSLGASFLLSATLAGCAASPGNQGQTGETTGGTGETDGTTTTGTSGQPGPISIANKVDLLFMIDNSRTMSDKQAVLDLAVPGLVRRLVNPSCVDPSGAVVSSPEGPSVPCPEGSARELEPVLDMHIGIVSSSLGGHGSDACSTSGQGKGSNNDRGYLIDRKDPVQGGALPTYSGLHFLAWDASQKLQPPGQADLQGLVGSFGDMVAGVGEVGCGYESQLESWYRFLVDPSPYGALVKDQKEGIVAQGVDTFLLQERKAFLRPSSLLVIVMLTDENDCSVRDRGQFYHALQQKGDTGSPYHLPRGRKICQTQPDDKCCFSCAQTGPKDDNGDPACAPDPTCDDPFTGIYLDEIEDNINLRCFDQKRRFGIDFLNPVERYIDGLTKPMVTDRNGQVVPNPIFSDLDPTDGDSLVRSKDLVVLTGIVGVPWQDIARPDAGGKPDLASGLDAAGKPIGGFKSAEEMAAPIPGKDYTTWDVILGDRSKYPADGALPKDPFMLETPEERFGVNPITGDQLLPPSTPNKLGNAINGHEITLAKRDDLQFACIFDLPESYVRDCSIPGQYARCDCEDKTNDSPLCEPDPNTGNPTMQVRAFAFPGIRELQVLQGIGPQGVVASICPKQLTAPAAPDFGYAPAMTALIERLKPHLQ